MSIKDRFILAAIICVFLSTLLLSRCVSYKKHKIIYQRPDTVYVKVPYKEVVVEYKEVEVPIEVIIYKRDTVFRQKIEKDTLISGVRIDNTMVEIHRITPDGIPLVDRHIKKPYETVIVDHKGKAKKKNKRKKRINRVITVVTGVAAFILFSLAI